MLLHSDPRGEWITHDFLLLEALQIMEQERCGQCGLPVWMCHDESGDVQFSIEEDECVAKRDTDIRREKEGDSKKAAHGVNYYPSPYFVNDADWLSVRDGYYERMAKRAEADAKERAEY